MRRLRNLVLIVLFAFCVAPLAAQVIDLDKPKEETKEKPEIWAKAAEADAKKAEEAARQDACTQLVEAAYRLPVSSNRDVLDMLIRNEAVNKDLIKGLAGAKAIAADYLDDGTVHITVSTTPDEVSAILKKAYANVDWDLAEEDSTIAAIAQRTKKDQTITAVGEGALPGSAGEKRIPVRRAALLKAEQDIAEKVLAMVLVDDPADRKRVRDFVLAFREMPRKTALGLSMTRIYSEEWAADGSVELRAELNVINVTDLIRLGQSLYDGRGKYNNWAFSSLTTATRDMIFQATVKAAPADTPGANAPLALELKALDEALKITPKN